MADRNGSGNHHGLAFLSATHRAPAPADAAAAVVSGHAPSGALGTASLAHWLRGGRAPEQGADEARHLRRQSSMGVDAGIPAPMDSGRAIEKSMTEKQVRDFAMMRGRQSVVPLPC